MNQRRKAYGFVVACRELRKVLLIAAKRVASPERVLITTWVHPDNMGKYRIRKDGGIQTRGRK